MLRLTLTRLVATSRITISSSKIITNHHRNFLRNFSSQSNDNIHQSKIPLANINKGEESKRMGIQFTCKVCDHRLQKTFTRQSYEQGVVIIRCDSCSSLHLIADNLGWFKDLTQNGKFKNIAQMLQAKGETIHRVTVTPTTDESILNEEKMTDKTKTVAKMNSNLIKEFNRYREENTELMNRFNELHKQIKKQRINSYEDLQQVNQHAAQTIVKLASNTKPFRLGGRAFGFYGLTSTGKSTIINKLLGYDLSDKDAGKTTKEIQRYEGQNCRLFDIPDKNDDMSYFTMEYIAFWKGLTKILVLITTTITEMTNVFHLLDALNLRYDIVINKFDLVPIEKRQEFKKKINQQICESELQGVDHVWYVSALNPNQCPDWLTLVNSLTYRPENVFNDYDSVDDFFYE
ncbi:unnamed protein product [Rotaria sordida]|uniref:DNL-type domain-containing protein n=1 Tax=Rotaria sordida TaxID=392033 RepID=A0A814TLB8_9BILA|nr:unnamed protein product [Rotaria sordida]